MVRHSKKLTAFLFSAVFILWIPIPGIAVDITLEWDKPLGGEDPAGYIVYYGTASRDYDFSVDVGNFTSCTISGLQDGMTYYFAATSYNAGGFESALSGEACFPDCGIAESTGSGGGCFIQTAGNNLNLWLLIPGIVFLLACGWCLVRRRGSLEASGPESRPLPARSPNRSFENTA